MEEQRVTSCLVYQCSRFIDNGPATGYGAGIMDSLIPNVRLQGSASRLPRLVARASWPPTRRRRWPPSGCRILWVKLRGYDPPPRAHRQRLPVPPAAPQADRRGGRGPAERALSGGRGRARQIHADGPVLRLGRGARASSASISTASCRTSTPASTRGSAPTRTATTRSRRWPTRSRPKRRCSASTSSRSTTSPTR